MRLLGSNPDPARPRSAVASASNALDPECPEAVARHRALVAWPWACLPAAALLIALAASVAGAQPEPTPAPELTGGIGWLNHDAPVTLESLRGKIVLLDFWTYC